MSLHKANEPANSSQSAPRSEPAPADRGALSRFLLYTLSIPERAVRSTIALAGGAAREAAPFLVPSAFQDSKSYEIVIRKSLSFLTENIGGVERATDSATAIDDDYLARKAVGNFVDLAGLATLHLSPMWLLAIISDVAYGSKSYLAELALELKSQGLLDDSASIAGAEEVLEAIRKASGKTAGMLDSPPLSLEELRRSLEEARQAAASANYTELLPHEELVRYWDEMRQIAKRDQVSLLEVSSAITLLSLSKLKTVTRGTLAGVKVAGGMLNRHVFGHYMDSLRTLHAQGFYATVRECYAPYVAAVWNNFAPDRVTWTEDVVTGRILGRIAGAVKSLFRSKQDATAKRGTDVSPGSSPTPHDS
jgi:hypothetical protein